MMPGSEDTAACIAMALKQLLMRDVAGERVVDALLRFDRYDRAPAGHGDGPFDGVGADIGAAIDGDDALAMQACRRPSDQVEGELDVDGVGGAVSSNN